MIVNFTLNGKTYNINAASIGDDRDQFTTSTSENGTLYNLMVKNGSISGVSVNKNISAINQTTDNSFGFVISPNLDTNSLSQSLNQVKSENQEAINYSKLSIMQDEKVTPYTISNLHVLASGWYVPLLIATGVAEGWAQSTEAFNGKYIVEKLQYSVASNWPSDGVVLWSDYFNSVSAYSTPAFPPAGQQNVSGSWLIDSSSGRFEAEATVSAFVKNTPIMWNVYDVSLVY